MTDGAKDPEKDLLGELESLVVVPEQLKPERVDHALVLIHEVTARLLIAQAAPLRERLVGFFELRPSDGPSWLHSPVLASFLIRPQQAQKVSVLVMVPGSCPRGRGTLTIVLS